MQIKIEAKDLELRGKNGLVPMSMQRAAKRTHSMLVQASTITAYIPMMASPKNVIALAITTGKIEVIDLTLYT